jgi:hypothetical protein
MNVFNRKPELLEVIHYQTQAGCDGIGVAKRVSPEVQLKYGGAVLHVIFPESVGHGQVIQVGNQSEFFAINGRQMGCIFHLV